MKNKGALIVLVFVIVFAAILWNSMGDLAQHRVEVCIEFQGRSVCRIASGATQEAALRAARDNACGILSSGVTDSIACQNTTPSKVTWLEKK